MRNQLPRAAQALTAFLIAMGRFQSSLSAPLTTEPGAAAVNALGIDLLKKACRPDSNALLSPYSIQTALAMAYAGADGVTREEMAKVLHYPNDTHVQASFPGAGSAASCSMPTESFSIPIASPSPFLYAQLDDPSAEPWPRKISPSLPFAPRAGVHPHRAPGRHCGHRHPGRDPFAGSVPREAKSPADQLHLQSQTDDPRELHVSERLRQNAAV